MTEEEFRAFMRRSVRRDGAGPLTGFHTGNGERYLLDEGESIRDAMLDHPSPVVVYIATVGQEFEHATCSEAPGFAQMCYGNARRMAGEMVEDGWRYCEGWARHRMVPDILVRHGWCVDEDGWVIEVTWDDPSDYYIGVVFDKIPPKRDGTIAITDRYALKQLAKITEKARIQRPAQPVIR